jgi:hypothetical protein
MQPVLAREVALDPNLTAMQRLAGVVEKRTDLIQLRPCSVGMDSILMWNYSRRGLDGSPTCHSFQTWFNSLFIDSLPLISCSVSTTWTEDRACSCHCQWSKEPDEITHILGNIF